MQYYQNAGTAPQNANCVPPIIALELHCRSRKAFDGCYFLPGSAGYKCYAGVDRLTVQVNGAGATLGHAATIKSISLNNG